MIGQEHRPVAHRKTLGDRPGQGRQGEPGDVESHPHRKFPVGLVLLPGRDAGQRDVRGTERIRTCVVKFGELINNLAMNQSLVFSLLHAIE